MRTKRFVLLDNGGETADRYTLIDTRPYRGSVSYVGFDKNPYSPQGIGQHGEMTTAQLTLHKQERFRTLGKSIKLEALPPQAQQLAKQFMDECLEADARANRIDR